MAGYARGRLTWGTCGRSGLRCLQSDLVRDGYNPNLMVLPSWRETRHPQEFLRARQDPIAVYNATPDYDAESSNLVNWNMHLGFILTDEDGTIIQFNPG